MGLNNLLCALQRWEHLESEILRLLEWMENKVKPVGDSSSNIPALFNLVKSTEHC